MITYFSHHKIMHSFYIAFYFIFIHAFYFYISSFCDILLCNPIKIKMFSLAGCFCGFLSLISSTFFHSDVKNKNPFELCPSKHLAQKYLFYMLAVCRIRQWLLASPTAGHTSYSRAVIQYFLCRSKKKKEDANVLYK